MAFIVPDGPKRARLQRTRRQYALTSAIRA